MSTKSAIDEAAARLLPMRHSETDRTETPEPEELWAVAVLDAPLSMLLLVSGQYPFDATFQFWQASRGNFNGLPPDTNLIT